jgi:hypothetical protein
VQAFIGDGVQVHAHGTRHVAQLCARVWEQGPPKAAAAAKTRQLQGAARTPEWQPTPTPTPTRMHLRTHTHTHTHTHTQQSRGHTLWMDEMSAWASQMRSSSL